MASNGAPASAPVSSNASPSSTPKREPSGTPAHAIAEQFSHQYYTVFSNYPGYLHRFYDQSSVQSIVEVTENGTVHEETATNQKDIHDVILRVFPEAKARVDHVSSQFSQNGGVMLQVSGTLFRRGRPDANFIQSFFLAVQERGFFVLNDLLNVMPSRTSHLRNEQPAPQKPEGVPQPRTPRDGMALGGQGSPSQAASGQPLPSANPPRLPDSEQINQILAETKQVLSSTVTGAQGVDGPPGAPQPTSYSALVKRNSGPQGAPAQMASLHGTEQPQGNDHAAHAPAAAGFLLNPRRRVPSNGGLPFQRNCSIFVRDVPNNIEEKDLKGVFEKFGPVTTVIIRTGKRDTRFAFIDFAETSAMEQALAADLMLGGRRLLIEEKKPLVLRNKPRYTQGRTSGDGSFGSSLDGNGANVRLGPHPCR